MSEYQYYEFAAIERPLTRTEMAKLRAVSTRAVITPVSFVNHYEWGDLKAKPANWMRRYFDAFVYTANWCSCRLALRVPLATFSKDELKPYASEYSLAIDASDEYWIFNWTLDESEDYDRFGEDDGSGWMRRLAPLRDELLRGDLRPLYLGWLAAVATMDEDTLEPEVPPGLADLSPAQQALAEFLEVDPDLLAAACVGNAPVSSSDTTEDQHIDTWLDSWSESDMKDLLRHIVLGRSHEAERQVKSRYSAWLKAQRPPFMPTGPRRQVAELHELARSAAVVRQGREAKTRIKQEARLRRQREAYLRRLMADVDKYWKAAHAQATRGTASGYDQASDMLVELAEGYTLVSSRAAFDCDLRDFLVPHTKRGALLRRLGEAGLWPKLR